MSPPVTLGKESGSMATTTTSPETDWRQEWFEFEDATYLNLAGQSPLPRVSIRAVEAALEAKKFPHHKTDATRSEEHTSELQSRLHLVCRLLLEKKKKQDIKVLSKYDRVVCLYRSVDNT